MERLKLVPLIFLTALGAIVDARPEQEHVVFGQRRQVNVTMRSSQQQRWHAPVRYETIYAPTYIVAPQQPWYCNEPRERVGIDITPGYGVSSIGKQTEPVILPAPPRSAHYSWLARDAKSTNEARLGEIAGKMHQLSGATIMGIRARGSSTWNMVLNWDDIDRYGDAHPSATIEAWFATDDSPLVVANLSATG